MPELVVKMNKKQAVEIGIRIGNFSAGTKAQKLRRADFIQRLMETWPELNPDKHLDENKVPENEVRKLSITEEEQHAILHCFLSLTEDEKTPTLFLSRMREEAKILRISKRFEHYLADGEVKKYSGDADGDPGADFEPAETVESAAA